MKMLQEMDLGSRPSLKQLVYENLQSRIIQGQLEPGTKLTEESVAQAMNISRAPIREALSMLERDGFVRVVPRKGAVIAEVTEKDTEDIWHFRAVLEPIAAREAMPYIPEQEIRRALEHVIDLQTASYTFDQYMASDLEVHALYYRYLDNEYMKAVLDNLKAHSLRVRWLREIRHRGSSDSMASVKEHRTILESLLRQDPEQVYDSVRIHIEKSAERLMKELEESK